MLVIDDSSQSMRWNGSLNTNRNQSSIFSDQFDKTLLSSIHETPPRAYLPIIIVTLNDLRNRSDKNTVSSYIWSLCSSVALPLIYLSPQIDISHSCPISVNHSPFCTSPQYQSRDYQFSSLSVSTIYTGSHTRRNQCSSCFFFACSLTLISLLIKLSQAFLLTSIIFFCNCQQM